MYLDFYKLEDKPFHITPDPGFLYLSPSHKEALASIIYGVEARKGFVTITGEVGVGKTTIIRSYLEKVDRKSLRTIYVFNSNVSFQGLLGSILRDLDHDVPNDVLNMVDSLHRKLIEEYKRGRNVVLIIDEAQNMPLETLENLRMLSNLETTKDKLLQILLVGQPELEKTLQLHELRQLRQRIAVRCRILPLNNIESMEYIRHRLSKVTPRIDSVFTKGALNRVVKEAKGIPRTINILCDNALITGFGYQKKPISARIVSEVAGDISGGVRRSKLVWYLGFALPVVAFGILVWVFPIGTWIDQFSPTAKLPAPKPSLVRQEIVLPQPAQLPSTQAPDKTALHEKAATLPEVADRSTEKTQMPGTETMPSAISDLFAEQPVAESVRFESPNVEPARHEPSGGEMEGLTALPFSTVSPPSEQSSSGALKVSAQQHTAPNATPVIRVARKGDTLSGLAVEVYGYSDEKLVTWVKLHNPHIKDKNRIHIGTEIYFPGANGPPRHQE